MYVKRRVEIGKERRARWQANVCGSNVRSAHTRNDGLKKLTQEGMNRFKLILADFLSKISIIAPIKSGHDSTLILHLSVEICRKFTHKNIYSHVKPYTQCSLLLDYMRNATNKFLGSMCRLLHNEIP